MYAIIIVPAIILVVIIITTAKNQLFNANGYNIKIEEASKSIELLQEETIKLLTKISKTINNQLDSKSFKSLTKIKNTSLNMLELDEYLKTLNNELKEAFEYNKIEVSKDDLELLNKYKNDKMEIEALKLYYNDNIDKLNKYLKSFKRIFIKFIKKYKKREKFNIVKEIEFEILKKKNNSKE